MTMTLWGSEGRGEDLSGCWATARPADDAVVRAGEVTAVRGVPLYERLGRPIPPTLIGWHSRAPPAGMVGEAVKPCSLLRSPA